MLIPAIGSCRFDSTGERRLAERLKQKLDDDYLLWHNVPAGGVRRSWKPRIGGSIPLRRPTGCTLGFTPTGYWRRSPTPGAKHCAFQVGDTLSRDSQLVHADGRHQGKLMFPWGYGVVLTRITRNQFEAVGLSAAIEPHGCLFPLGSPAAAKKEERSAGSGDQHRTRMRARSPCRWWAAPRRARVC